MARKKPIISPLGQWAYPGEVTVIPSSNITMKGVNYPVLGIDDLGNQQMMMPGGEYTFPGNYVTEIPQMGKGGLSQWFDEKWVDVKTGKTCGRSGKDKDGRPYPACRPSRRVNETTPKTTSEMSSAEKARFKREKTSGKRIDYNHKRREDGGETWLDQYQDGGLLSMGDYDLTTAPKRGDYLLPDINRPSYIDDAGERRTEYKIGKNIEGKETLIPTVVGGRQLSEDEALDRYYKTGLHMGQFNTPEEANYAARLRTARYKMLEDPIGFKADQFQVGGGRRPIYTSNPRDPRIGRYRDSLNLYKKGESDYASYLKTNKRLNIPSTSTLIENNPYVYDGDTPAKIQPIISHRYWYNHNPDVISGTNIPSKTIKEWTDRYKKPVQPYIYKKPEVSPIYTSDINDPRLRSYNDSLSLYKDYSNPIEISKVFKKIKSDPAFRYYRSRSTAELNSFPGKIKPISGTEWNYSKLLSDFNAGKNTDYGYYPFYDERGVLSPTERGTHLAFKKPVQPYIYKKPEVIPEVIETPLPVTPIELPVKKIGYNKPIIQQFNYMSNENKAKALQKYGSVGDIPFQGVDINQLKDGGWLDEFQVGGGRAPMYTSNPNDPRIRNYSDSLDLYNKNTLGAYNLLKKYPAFKLPKVGNINKDNDDFGNLMLAPYYVATEKYLDYGDYIRKNNSRGIRKNNGNVKDVRNYDFNGRLSEDENKIKPIGYQRVVESTETFNDYSNFFPVYKKPVQPIIYKPSLAVSNIDRDMYTPNGGMAREYNIGVTLQDGSKKAFRTEKEYQDWKTANNLDITNAKVTEGKGYSYNYPENKKYGGWLSKYQEAGEAPPGKSVQEYTNQFNEEISGLKDWYEANRKRIGDTVPEAYLRNDLKNAKKEYGPQPDPENYNSFVTDQEYDNPRITGVRSKYDPVTNTFNERYIPPAFPFNFPELKIGFDNSKNPEESAIGIPNSYTYTNSRVKNNSFVVPYSSDYNKQLKNKGYIKDQKISVDPTAIDLYTYKNDPSTIMSHETSHYLNKNNPEVFLFNRTKLAEMGITDTEGFNNYYSTTLNNDRKEDELLSDAYALKQDMRKKGFYDYTKGEKLTPKIWNKYKKEYPDNFIINRFTPVFENQGKNNIEQLYNRNNSIEGINNIDTLNDNYDISDPFSPYLKNTKETPTFKTSDERIIHLLNGIVKNDNKSSTKYAKYGGWLNKYPTGGAETSTEQNPDRMQAVDIRKKRSWSDKLRGFINQGEKAIGLDPYNERSDDFMEQWARRVNNATGGRDWYKQPNDASGPGGIGTAMMETVMAPFSAPQLASVYGATGKVQMPSEAMNIQNPYLAFGVNAVTDPLSYVGAGLTRTGQKFIKGLSQQAGNLLESQIKKSPRLSLSLQKGRPVSLDNVNSISGIRYGDLNPISKNPVTEHAFFRQLEKGVESLDNSVSKRVADLESEEGFRRLVEQEKAYLFDNTDTDLSVIDRVAKINAKARIEELKNVKNVNKEATEYANTNYLGTGLTNPFVEDSYLYNNAYHRPASLYDQFVKSSGTLNLKKPIPNYSKSIPGEIGMGYNFVGDVPTEMHEIGHVLQRGRKVSLDTGLKNIIPKKQLKPSDQRAYKYFMKGSSGSEPTAFANELREAMFQKGFIPDYYTPINQQQIQDAYKYFKKNPMGIYDKNTGNFSSNTRIFDFMQPNKANSKLLTDVLNRLPAVAPLAVGTAAASQLQEQKKGGQTSWLNKYK